MFTIHAPSIITPNEVAFRYSCSRFGAFEERVTWPVSNSGVHGQPAILNLMAALLGVSYYKANASADITVEVPLGAASRAAVTACYTEGLGEFLFRNALP